MADGLSIYRTVGGGGAIHVRHVPEGEIRTMPREHYSVQAGPGVTYLPPEALDDLIDGLVKLRKAVLRHGA